MPVFRDVIDSPRWRALPHREELAELSETAEALPRNVRRQFPIETIVGQEASAAIGGGKSIPEALRDMQRRVNDVLENL